MSGEMSISKQIASITKLETLKGSMTQLFGQLPNEKKEKAKVIHAISRQAIKLAKAEAKENPKIAMEALKAIDETLSASETHNKLKTVVHRIFGSSRTRVIRTLQKKIDSQEKQRMKLWNQLVDIGKQFGFTLNQPDVKSLSELEQKLTQKTGAEPPWSQNRRDQLPVQKSNPLASKGLELLEKYRKLSSQ